MVSDACDDEKNRRSCGHARGDRPRCTAGTSISALFPCRQPFRVVPARREQPQCAGISAWTSQAPICDRAQPCRHPHRRQQRSSALRPTERSQNPRICGHTTRPAQKRRFRRSNPEFAASVYPQPAEPGFGSSRLSMVPLLTDVLKVGLMGWSAIGLLAPCRRAMRGARAWCMASGPTRLGSSHARPWRGGVPALV